MRISNMSEDVTPLTVPEFAAPLDVAVSSTPEVDALVSLHVDIEDIKEPCLNFLDSLWTSQGGFYGHWEDDAIDCEYTYYGLLALGHLSL